MFYLGLLSFFYTLQNNVSLATGYSFFFKVSVMNIGKAITLCRNQKGITKTQLAKDSELSISYLTLLEQGKREPNLSAINAICKALQIPPSILIFLASDSTEQKGISLELAEKLSHLALSLMEPKSE